MTFYADEGEDTGAERYWGCGMEGWNDDGDAVSRDEADALHASAGC